MNCLIIETLYPKRKSGFKMFTPIQKELIKMGKERNEKIRRLSTHPFERGYLFKSGAK